MSEEQMNSVDFLLYKLMKMPGIKESVTYQAILREGREQGRKEGRCQVARERLVKAGEKYLGVPNAETVDRINSITDVDILDNLFLRLIEVESWSELLAESNITDAENA